MRLSADVYEAGLSRWAQRSAASRGRERPEEPCTLRTPYQRDRDRIVHCKSFRRLKHKTQVFIAPEGDHYRTRLTHTLEVSGIARTIARALRLNEDLAEAVALGHDLGHTPFGHAGEDGHATRCCEELGARRLPAQRAERSAWSRCWRTTAGASTSPGRCATASATIPATRCRPPSRASIVRFADRIAYINHDIDDALRAGLITAADLPAEPDRLCWAQTGSDRIDALVHDLVDTSDETGDIVQSPDVGEAMDELRELPVPDGLSRSRSSRPGSERVRHVITNLMQHFLEHPEEHARAGGAGRASARRGRPGAATGGGRPAADAASGPSPTTSPGMTDRYAQQPATRSCSCPSAGAACEPRP